MQVNGIFIDNLLLTITSQSGREYSHSNRIHRFSLHHSRRILFEMLAVSQLELQRFSSGGVPCNYSSFAAVPMTYVQLCGRSQRTSFRRSNVSMSSSALTHFCRTHRLGVSMSSGRRRPATWPVNLTTASSCRIDGSSSRHNNNNNNNRTLVNHVSLQPLIERCSGSCHPRVKQTQPMTSNQQNLLHTSVTT